MTDFKAGDKVVVRDDIARLCSWWTAGKVYTVNESDCVIDDIGSSRGLPMYAQMFEPAPAPDADGWYPMPKLKAGDPIPEWLVDERTEYREKGGVITAFSVYASLGRFFNGSFTRYRPAPQTVTATTADGKEYRITHNPDGSVSAEVV